MGAVRYKMKYKVGDKVKIKTWEEMEKEYGLNNIEGIKEYICCLGTFTNEMEEFLNKSNCDRVLTIREIDVWYYIKGVFFCWSDDMIECLVEEYKEEVVIPIKNRWELLDL